MRRLFKALGRGGRPLRIGYGRIFHEACADSPVLTTEADFRRMHHLEGAKLAEAASLRGTELKSFFPHAELTGFVAAARAAGKVEAVPLASSLAIPGGPVTRECFEWLILGLVRRLEEAGPLDGVYLALHGSMQVVGLDEAPEAVILRRVREVVGPLVKLVASFDLHGNITPAIVRELELLVAYRSNPHWDLAPTGFRAGNRLIRCLREQVRPVKAWRKLPVLLGGGTTLHMIAPMRRVFSRMRAMERDPRVLATSLFMVHPFTASTELGWSVHVATDGDSALAEKLADELAELAWEASRTPIPELLGIDAAIARAKVSPWRKLGPVTFVDTDDTVGAGAPGGSTQIVRALVEGSHSLRALIPVHDPELYAALVTVPLGTTVEVVLRGTPGYAQPPVKLCGVVAAKAESEFGKRVRLEVGGLEVAISAEAPLPIHPRYWRELGVSPRDYDVIVQKNLFHYRIFYAAISFEHLPVMTRGATSLRGVVERARSIPMRPREPLEDWRAGDRHLRG
ncbi:MAG: M81 family peptidase [Myxococcales bacterium]|nr:M81 family peptidase [Myxococcales bacterium]